MYLNVTAGYNNRTGGFSDEVRYGIELGATIFSSRLTLIGRLTGIESMRNGETAASVNSTSIFSNNSEHTSLGVEAAYHLSKRYGISASYTGALRGQLIFASPSYSVGIFTSF